MKQSEGFAGALAKIFVNSKLTPVIAISSILIGIGAVILTPKEEEPQITVPMIDILTPAPGFESKETERKVTEPIERALWGLEGVEYVYSASQPHQSLVTVRFKVGEPVEPSLVKIHHKLQEIKADLPPIAQNFQIRSLSIDDVPFLILTFHSSTLSHYELRSAIAPLARELSSTPDLSRVELLGGQKRTFRVIVDPQKLAQHGLTLNEVAQSLKANDALSPTGKNWGSSQVLDVEVGSRLSRTSEIDNIAIAQKGGKTLHIHDVAEIQDGPEALTRASVLLEKNPTEKSQPNNAVSIVFAKRKGTNVVILAKEILERAEVFKKSLPPNIQFSILRNYGETAAEKSKELIEHLLLATLSVSLLIALAMGIRSSLVVAIAIPVTLALTIAIYYFMGYTLNRVTLFALIFSIGILVDDAIVVVENIERHLHLDRKSGILAATLKGVSEVGNPTILATFTVIAAILPMAFVRGLMGPYMKPIPVGASLAMLLSLFVAFIVTPWAAVRLLKHEGTAQNHSEGKLDILYQKIVNWLLDKKSASWIFGGFTLLLFLMSASLVYFKTVKVKMLPFDNKNEFQVLLDFPPETPLTDTLKKSTALAQELAQNPDIERIQVYAGEPAPFSFSGMVKHTYLRKRDSFADLQIRLTNKSQRKKSSHEIISELRVPIRKFSEANQIVSKVLEIPPGPPVMATMVAEIYGPTHEIRTRITQEILAIFQQEPSVVDLDTSFRHGRDRLRYPFDLRQGGLLGIKTQQAIDTGQLLFSETSLLSLADASAPEEITIDLSVTQKNRSGPSPFRGLQASSFESGMVALEKTLKAPEIHTTETLHRKNLKPVSYVLSELSGEEEAPVYGMLKLSPKIPYPTQTAEVPWNTQNPIIKWDGEWFITYEVFRDLGTAFAVVMILIYILVLGWFRSYLIPLIIMAPIPISLIGILPGHALFGAFFTATSMIGFIAGAGIIVRNSIILVDFIEHQLQQGYQLREAVISAGVLRFRPMLMTAAAVVVGSSVMLFDPIFQGLALSLMFGEIAATLLSRLAVPILYYWFAGKMRIKTLNFPTTLIDFTSL